MSSQEETPSGNRRNELSIKFFDEENKKTIRRATRLDIFVFLMEATLGVGSFYLTNGGIQIVEKTSVMSLAVGLFVYLITFHFGEMLKARFAREHEHKIDLAIQSRMDTLSENMLYRVASSERKMRALLRSANVAVLKEPQAREKIEAALATATRVKNTFVNIKDQTGTRTGQTAEIVKRYEKFLSKDSNLEWHDAVGLDDFFDGRFDAIFADQPPPQCGQHHITILKSGFPIINFCLTAKRDAEFSELFFGWVTSSDTSSSTFHTTDPEMIKLFNRYFGQLVDSPDAIRLDVAYDVPVERRFSNDRFRDYVGRWISISTTKQGEQQNTQRGVGYLDFKLRFDKNWQIEGDFRSQNGKSGTMRSEHCILLGDALYYTFVSKGAGQKDGFGSWSLPSRQPPGGSGLPFMEGYYCERDQTTRRLTKAFKIMPDAPVSSHYVNRLLDQENLAKVDVVTKRT